VVTSKRRLCLPENQQLILCVASALDLVQLLPALKNLHAEERPTPLEKIHFSVFLLSAGFFRISFVHAGFLR
jgi:hypothetical protein